MERLAGEIYFSPFKHQNYGYRIPAAKLFHINGTPREEYIPTHYVNEKSNRKDEILDKGLSLMQKLIK
jgi:carboxyl-terminal processing protease